MLGFLVAFGDFKVEGRRTGSVRVVVLFARLLEGKICESWGIEALLFNRLLNGEV